MIPALRIVNILLGLLALSGLLITGSGCSGSEEKIDDTPYVVDYTKIFRSYTFSSIDADGLPADECSVFTTDTPIIYFTWQPRSLDVCCAATLVIWYFEGEEIQHLSLMDSSTCVHTASLEKPEGGFEAGNYQVALYIGISEYLRLDFMVK
ncbi:hypothetical protein VLL09_03705 [Dehalococcoides mccartyi]|uniref:Lipoprotein n=1 Tax=Dehalococcoides mccartyi TaxID=61435 RepID=A0AB38ZBP9_9CHLR|nr:hypothetical protein [Dehalococcoides mccartyi]WRO08004.1 hypothetical protein VLL09_03705 [Dehalococcoides mccartyi]